MIKIENVDVFGWESAIRGMRNPLNSWDKSDSTFRESVCSTCPCVDMNNIIDNKSYVCMLLRCPEEIIIGESDLKLMKSLSRAGNDHAKFLRMINVTLDITAPLYWWKEYDTYKVGTVANSCSTMHKIHAKEFTLDDFSCEHLISPTTRYDVDCSVSYGKEQPWYPHDVMVLIVDALNKYRELYLETKDKDIWWQMIQLLPSSYNQKRTVQLNYQVLKSMYFARRNHKLDCWVEFCKWIETLPYFKEICIND